MHSSTPSFLNYFSMALSYLILITTLLQYYLLYSVSLATASAAGWGNSTGKEGVAFTHGRVLELTYNRSIPLADNVSVTPAAATTTSNVSRLGCPDKCGNLTIPYPFGIGPGCYREGFDITCDESITPHKPLLRSGNIEMAYINITGGEAHIYKHIAYRCYNQSDQLSSNNSRSFLDLTHSPAYFISYMHNKFTVIGCYTLAYMSGLGKVPYTSGCASFCQDLNSTTRDNDTCNGLGCCQTTIPPGLNYYEVQWGYEENQAWDFNPCNYAVVMEDDGYTFQGQDLIGKNFLQRNERRVQMVLDWAIRDNGTCLDSDMEKRPHSACLSENSRCKNTTNGDGYLCRCLPGYDGNPYLPDGCKDIDECTLPEKYPCLGKCTNKKGSYECTCKRGTKGNATTGGCTEDPALVITTSILGVSILLGLCFLAATYLQHRRHIKEKQEYQRYYQMMDSHLRVFSKKQMENATNHYGETNVIGVGGQGKVYKGLLEGNQAVAIKKAKKEVDETQREEFVNEINLLSQINHKNIVRLLGCCLEVKIPMLVYEFVPNGSLFDLLHRKSRRNTISLGSRLRIALDSAMALDYLHSSISRSILHGDVKSANILLDADYSVKISDFGASSVVPLNEIVELVHFSYGYLDPECMSTRIITKKSDVYSFGVVILELITRKEAVYLNEKGERESLATSFLSKTRKNKHREMLDAEIVLNEETMEVLEDICMITAQCLSPTGEDRPTMRQVVEELQRLVRSHCGLPNKQIDQRETDSLLGEQQFSSVSDAKVFYSTEYSAVLEMSTEAPR